MGFRRRVTVKVGGKKPSSSDHFRGGGILKFCSFRHLIKLSRTPRSKGGSVLTGSGVSFLQILIVPFPKDSFPTRPSPGRIGSTGLNREIQSARLCSSRIGVLAVTSRWRHWCF